VNFNRSTEAQGTLCRLIRSANED